MSDLIDRQAAIDELHMHLMYRMGTESNKQRLDAWINNLPSAQPETHDKRTETHACDLISRQAALDCFHDWIDRRGDVHTSDEMPEYNAIEALPSAQPEQRWIPCSEMMPVSDGIYIVDDYRHGKHWVHTVGYMKRSNSWCEQHGIYYDDKYGRYDKQEDIIAWMPLPEPYREEL